MRIRNAVLITTRWDAFSERFVKFHRLPFGTELRLYDADNRKKRRDFMIQRKQITTQTSTVADDNDTVATLLGSASALLSIDLEARRLHLRLYDPEGRRIVGQTQVRTVRLLPPAAPPKEIVNQEPRSALIEKTKAIALSVLKECEHGVDEPHTIVCAAFVLALVERYERKSVMAALGD